LFLKDPATTEIYTLSLHDALPISLSVCKSAEDPAAAAMADPGVEQRVGALADVSVSDIAQRYKMQEELGSGAQATVYRATRTHRSAPGSMHQHHKRESVHLYAGEAGVAGT